MGLSKPQVAVIGGVFCAVGAGLFFAARGDAPREAAPEGAAREATERPPPAPIYADPPTLRTEASSPGRSHPRGPARPEADAPEAAAPEADAPEGAYDPPLPTLGVEEPMAVADPDAPPFALPVSRRTEPITPAQELEHAVFLGHVVQAQLTRLRERVEWARSHNNPAALQRAQRALEQLEAQQPEVNRRIERLREQAP